jgi:AraC-like DNA-binding protein
MAELHCPLDALPQVLAAGRYPLADRAHEITYGRSPSVALHLHEVHGVLRREGVGEPFRPGELLITFPQQATTYALERPQRLWCIHFSLARGHGPIARIPSTVVLGANRNSVVERMAQVSRLHAAATSVGGSAVDALGCAQASTVLLEILLTLGDISRRSDQSLTRPDELVLTQVAAWIEAHATQTISIPTLAHRFGFHQHTLARLFRGRFGSTMQGYQLSCRISQARHLLEHADIPVHELARQLGFTDSQHFSKHFRARHGMAPQRYRRHASRFVHPG